MIKIATTGIALTENDMLLGDQQALLSDIEADTISLIYQCLIGRSIGTKSIVCRRLSYSYES